MALQALQNSQVNVFQCIYIAHADMLINFVDAVIGGAQLNHLGAYLRDETCVAGAPCCGQLCVNAGFGLNGLLNHAQQIARGGEEWQAT